MKYKIKDVISSSVTGQWGEDCNDNNGTPVFGVSNLLKNGKIDFSKLAYRSIKPNKLSTSYVRNGDILIAKSGNPKVCYYQGADDIYCACNFILTLRSNTEIIESKYLYYAIKQLFLCGDINRCYTSTTIPNLSTKSFFDCSIDVPSKEKQLLVVNQLTKLDMLAEYRETQLLLFDELVKARFVEMFGTLGNPSKAFRKEMLKNLCIKITDGKHGGCTAESGTKRFFVGAREIYDDIVHYDTAPEISKEDFEKDYKRCNVEIGDFLIVNTGATIGKSAITIDQRTEHTLLQKSVALLKVRKEVLNTVFLKWCYRVNTGMYMVESASAQPNLLLSKINSTEIYVPPMELQEQFAAFVKQIDKSKFIVQQALDKAQVLYDSLMQKYFG